MNELRIVQVGFDLDDQRRNAATLLEAWPTLPSVATAAARAGLTVTVVQAAHRDETIERDGVVFHFVRALTRRRLVDRIRVARPDVVHVHGLNHPLAVYQLSRSLNGVPILVQDHGSVAPRHWRRHVARFSYLQLSGVAFTARDQAVPFLQAGALPSEIPVFEVIESSSRFGPGDLAAAQDTTGMVGDPCLLWTGRLDGNKDPLTVLTAFELAAADVPRARLWCCFGAAPLRAAVERRIAGSSLLRERVTLVGQRPHAEMELRYRAADFFVQASHREGSGYSILEALSCGTVPLVTDIPSARRIVGDAGSLTPVGDAPAMARAMVAWAARERLAMRRAARERFEAALTFDVIGRELRCAYESLAAAR